MVSTLPCGSCCDILHDMKTTGAILGLCASLACSDAPHGAPASATRPASAMDGTALNNPVGTAAPTAPEPMRPVASAAGNTTDASAAGGQGPTGTAAAGTRPSRPDADSGADDANDASTPAVDCGSCTKLDKPDYCQPAEVTWQCQSSVPTALRELLLANRCHEAATALIRFCCPAAARITCLPKATP